MPAVSQRGLHPLVQKKSLVTHLCTTYEQRRISLLLSSVSLVILFFIHMPLIGHGKMASCPKKDNLPARITKLSPEKGCSQTSAQSKSSPSLQKKRGRAGELMFRLPGAKLRNPHSSHGKKGQGWGTPPPLLCRYNLKQGERKEVLQLDMPHRLLRLSMLHQLSFMELSQHTNYREKNPSQMFAKALIRHRTCSNNGYSTTCSA